MGARGSRWSDIEARLIDHIKLNPKCTTSQLTELFGGAAPEVLETLASYGTLGFARIAGPVTESGRHLPEYVWWVHLDRSGRAVKRPVPVSPEIAWPYFEEPTDKREWVLFMSQMLGAYYSAKNYAVCREVGMPHYLDNGAKFGTLGRADFVAVSSSLKEIVIVETKSCWADFASDAKWQGYLAACNKFYFAADEQTAARILAAIGEEHPDVGVIAVKRNMTPYAVTDNLNFIRSAHKHASEIAVADLLWQMAARSSGFDFSARLQHGNTFERRTPAWPHFRIR